MLQYFVRELFPKVSFLYFHVSYITSRLKDAIVKKRPQQSSSADASEIRN